MTSSEPASARPWWKDAVVYQIYPASFKDSNGDGVGDIPGITQSLDYIQSLGVTAIWICPMYASPQVDMGYDVSDYEAVHAPYGTMQDMEVLIEEAHRRGLRIILDLVVNHTSDQHAWFRRSRSSKADPMRDWYIWRPAKHGVDGERLPPNNWRSHFGGSAWTFDEETQEYYLHLFCPEQPDLNWDNREARQAIYQSAMVSWLEKGVDGFRVDSVNMYSKPPGLPDAPNNDPDSQWQEAGPLYCNGPRIDEYLEEMNEILARYDAMTVGECPNTPDRQRVVAYVSAKQKRLNMVFQFEPVDVGLGKTHKFATEPFNYSLADIKRAIRHTQSLLDGTDAWTTSFVENHDQARCVSRFGDDSPQWRARSAKCLAMLFACLSGTLFVYQGQEIGMINMPRSWPIGEYKDVDSLNHYKSVAERSNADPAAIASVRSILQHLARDHARTPMQWTPGPNAGFAAPGVTPWMRANPCAAEGVNVAQESADERSVLAFWRRTLRVRKALAEVLVHGTFSVVDEANETVFSFVKSAAADGSKSRALVVCNLSGSRGVVPEVVEGFDRKTARLVMENVSGGGDDDDECGSMTPDPEGDVLQPWEARLYVVS